MCSLTRKQLKSFDAIASCVRRQGSSLRAVVSMHHVFLTGEQFKSCVVNLSCVGQQGSSLKVIVSMHHVFGNKATVSKLWCQCFKYLSTVKQFKSCGVDASRIFLFFDREAF